MVCRNCLLNHVPPKRACRAQDNYLGHDLDSPAIPPRRRRSSTRCSSARSGSSKLKGRGCSPACRPVSRCTWQRCRFRPPDARGSIDLVDLGKPFDTGAHLHHDTCEVSAQGPDRTVDRVDDCRVHLHEHSCLPERRPGAPVLTSRALASQYWEIWTAFTGFSCLDSARSTVAPQETAA